MYNLLHFNLDELFIVFDALEVLKSNNYDWNLLKTFKTRKNQKYSLFIIHFNLSICDILMICSSLNYCWLNLTHSALYTLYVIKIYCYYETRENSVEGCLMIMWFHIYYLFINCISQTRSQSNWNSTEWRRKVDEWNSLF